MTDEILADPASGGDAQRFSRLSEAGRRRAAMRSGAGETPAKQGGLWAKMVQRRLGSARGARA